MRIVQVCTVALFTVKIQLRRRATGALCLTPGGGGISRHWPSPAASRNAKARTAGACFSHSASTTLRRSLSEDRVWVIHPQTDPVGRMFLVATAAASRLASGQATCYSGQRARHRHAGSEHRVSRPNSCACSRPAFAIEAPWTWFRSGRSPVGPQLPPREDAEAGLKVLGNWLQTGGLADVWPMARRQRVR